MSTAPYPISRVMAVRCQLSIRHTLTYHSEQKTVDISDSGVQAYFVRNISNTSRSIRHSLRCTGTPLPPLLSPIAPPRFPDAAKTSLASMRPLSLVGRFNCERRCRSFGICIHFQFCCGMENCPVGWSVAGALETRLNWCVQK
jgi:hypothetical protein